MNDKFATFFKVIANGIMFAYSRSKRTPRDLLVYVYLRFVPAVACFPALSTSCIYFLFEMIGLLCYLAVFL